MVENVVSTKVRRYLATDRAMEILQAELERDRKVRSRECHYCFAQPGDACHTKAGLLRAYYHVGR